MNPISNSRKTLFVQHRPIQDADRKPLLLGIGVAMLAALTFFLFAPSCPAPTTTTSSPAPVSTVQGAEALPGGPTDLHEGQLYVQKNRPPN